MVIPLYPVQECRFLISKLTKEQIVKNSLKSIGSFEAFDAFKSSAKTGVKGVGVATGSAVGSGLWNATKGLMGFNGGNRRVITTNNKTKNRNKRNTKKI